MTTVDFCIREFESVEDVIRCGMVTNVPQKETNLTTRMYSSGHKTIVGQLVDIGYDLRLGEKGRALLKKELSSKFKTDEFSRRVAGGFKLKNAHVVQLFETAEKCGLLRRALHISNDYWAVNGRKNIFKNSRGTGKLMLSCDEMPNTVNKQQPLDYSNAKHEYYDSHWNNQQDVRPTDCKISPWYDKCNYPDMLENQMYHNYNMGWNSPIPTWPHTQPNWIPLHDLNNNCMHLRCPPTPYYPENNFYFDSKINKIPTNDALIPDHNFSPGFHQNANIKSSYNPPTNYFYNDLSYKRSINSMGNENEKTYKRTCDT